MLKYEIYKEKILRERFLSGISVSIYLLESGYLLLLHNRYLKLLLLLPLSSVLLACGGGSNESSDLDDITAPSGYAVSSLTDPVDINNQTNVSFHLTEAEIGSVYRYTFTDEQNAHITGTGPVTLSSEVISGINLSELADGLVTLQLALTDSSGNIGPLVEATSNKNAQPELNTVEISGQITFDRVPYNFDGIGLDYDGTFSEPIKEATIRVRDSAGQILLSSKTDNAGYYQVDVPINIEVRIEVLAELYEASPVLNWLARVVDDSNGNALYILSGSLTDSGETGQIRNLHADSGWDGATYASTRSAAPFAILDSLYKIYDLMREENISLSMPELEVRWSPNNSNGSFYRSGINNYIEIAGTANLDTDEYDQHVIIHEWLHYYEDRVSRGDTIGGAHSINDRLEPRTAYSEGRGNAWSGIVLKDPIYKDAIGTDQQNGFELNLENEPGRNSGWYVERSVQEIIYDLVDTENEGLDSLTLSVADLINSWQSPSYINQSSLTTIFSFREVLEQSQPSSATAIADLMQREDISGTGIFGEGETNDGGRPYGLPVYYDLTVGTVPFEICSDNQEGEYNHLENRQLLRFSISNQGNYKIEMSRDAGNTNFDASVETDPDFIVYLRDSTITNYEGGEGGSSDVDNETFIGEFEAGDYILEAFDWFNTDDNSFTGGLSCFDISVISN